MTDLLTILKTKSFNFTQRANYVFSTISIKTNCSELKIINNSKIDIENDAQRVRGECRRGKIVLYSFETKNKISIFRFINTCTNGSLELEVNENYELKVSGRGSF